VDYSILYGTKCFYIVGMPEELRSKASVSFSTQAREGHLAHWHLVPQGSGALSDKAHTFLSSAQNYPAALGSVEWKSRVHCWQCRINQLSGWMGVGASQKKPSYMASTYGDPSFWGWSYTNQSYNGGNYNGHGVQWSAGQHIHFRLDLDRLTFKTFCIESKATHEWTGLPAAQLWVANIIVQSGTSVTITPITDRDFAKRVVPDRFSIAN